MGDSTPSEPSLDELTIADDPVAWGAAGFTLEGDVSVVGSVRLRLAGTGQGRGIGQGPIA